MRGEILTLLSGFYRNGWSGVFHKVGSKLQDSNGQATIDFYGYGWH